MDKKSSEKDYMMKESYVARVTVYLVRCLPAAMDFEKSVKLDHLEEVKNKVSVGEPAEGSLPNSLSLREGNARAPLPSRRPLPALEGGKGLTSARPGREESIKAWALRLLAGRSSLRPFLWTRPRLAGASVLAPKPRVGP